MYEAKYSKYITKSKARFATDEEIKNECYPIDYGEDINGCGVPLYFDFNRLYVDTSDAHYYIQGQTGSKKSRIIETNTIHSIIKAGENAIINDPKGEAYRRTAIAAKKNGYKLTVLNLRDLSKSNGWNPLGLPYKFYEKGNMPEAEQAINDFAEAVMGSATVSATDKYWPDCATLLLTYCSELLMDSVPIEYFNMSNVIQLTHECNTPTLRQIMNNMDQSSSAAICMHAILDLVAEKTSSCIFSTLKQGLKPFIQNKSLLDLLCKNDIDFEDFINQKYIIYLIYPDEKTSLSFLITLFFTQCYQFLIASSAAYTEARLPIRVNFLLDEFSNLPAVENFENRISEARGHNIRYFLFGQSFGQLKTKYKENADTIISNCDWILFPSKEYGFLEKVSQICGKEYDYYGMEHDLVDVSDMQHLKKYEDGAEVLIIKSGQFPFITKLPDYQYINLFGRHKEAKFEEIKSTFIPSFLTFNDWIEGIDKIFNFPFPKEERKTDLRYTHTVNKNRSVNSKTKKIRTDIEKELSKKFDELFGNDDFNS